MSDTHLDEISFLIVDDSQSMLTILRECLKAFGAVKIHEAKDAAEAFEIFKTAEIDFAIVDYLMEPLDGLDFIRLIRTAKDSPNQQLPIILLTAFTDVMRVKAARDAGASDVLCKPVSAATLYDRIQTVFKVQREFIEGQHFTGPDRRRKRKKNIVLEEGTDRRDPKVVA